MSLQGLLARARLYIRRFACRLVVVDYIRLISAPGRELREQVGNVTDSLRQLAKTEQVGVVALSQLARPRDRNPNSRPSMLGLKESGDIEAHAHVVLLIHMPLKQGEPTGEDEIIIGKNRHGPMGAIEVSFNRETLSFMPRSK
jgi:replicative DNA helicase